MGTSAVTEYSYASGVAWTDLGNERCQPYIGRGEFEFRDLPQSYNFGPHCTLIEVYNDSETAVNVTIRNVNTNLPLVGSVQGGGRMVDVGSGGQVIHTHISTPLSRLCIHVLHSFFSALEVHLENGMPTGETLENGTYSRVRARLNSEFLRGDRQRVVEAWLPAFTRCQQFSVEGFDQASLTPIPEAEESEEFLWE